MDIMGRAMLRVAWLGTGRARDRLGFARLAILIKLCINQCNPEDDVDAAGDAIRVTCLKMVVSFVGDLGSSWL